MKCSLGISNFLEEISSLSHSVVFLYFFALIAHRIHFLEKAAVEALALEEDTRKFQRVVSSAKRSLR